MKSNFISRADAPAVADVLGTVAELRQALKTATQLRRGLPGKWPIVAIEAQDRADRYVRELTDRVRSRARASGLDTNALIALASAVIDGHRRLPDGAEAMEAA